MSLTISDLVRRFDSGEIRLPLMQRDYVWKAKKVVRLLDSLYRGWPIGSFYVWQTQDGHASRARVGATPAKRLDGFYGFLLDGQQRLTSLSLAIQGESVAELPQRGFFDVENEVFYLGTMKRTIQKRILNGDPLIVPLSEIISTGVESDSEIFRSIETIVQAIREQNRLGKFEMQYRERLHIVAKMLTRSALCETFCDDHEEFAFEVFSRLNKGGTSLSTGEVEAARLASAATRKIVEPMRAMVGEKEMRALGINFVFLLRALVTVHRGNSSFSKLPKSWAEDSGEIEDSWRKTEKSLRSTVQFIREDLGWTTRRWLPSTMALLPIVYCLAKTGSYTINPTARTLFRRYLLITGLRSLFRGSPETQVNFFVNSARDASGDLRQHAAAVHNRIAQNQMYAIKPEEIQRTTGMYSPLMQVYLSYLISEDARSWPSGRTIKGILHDGLASDPIAVHHIFPKQYMQELNYPVSFLNTVPNYAILSQADNSELGDRNPLEAWRSLQANQREYASFQYCFVANDSFLRHEAFDEFLEHRATKLADQLNKFIGLGKYMPSRKNSAG